MAHLGEGADSFGLIHADLHLGNALFWGDEVRVIDFDDCGFGYWLYDIAVSLWELRHRNDYEQFRSALIDGYTRHRPLPPGDLAHLDDFIATRDVAFGLWCLPRRPRPGAGRHRPLAGHSSPKLKRQRQQPAQVIPPPRECPRCRADDLRITRVSRRIARGVQIRWLMVRSRTMDAQRYRPGLRHESWEHSFAGGACVSAVTVLKGGE
jgi:phosphotransferase family enzyme